MLMTTFTCSECGKQFPIFTPLTNYQYKLSPSQCRGSSKIQCSYTCNDHASLRLLKKQHISPENFKKYVINSENMMRSQGKTILHPIEIE